MVLIIPFLGFLALNVDLGILKKRMVLLRFWVFQHMYVVNDMKKGRLIEKLRRSLLLVVVMFFLSKKRLTFYVFFEMRLLPTVAMIFFFGYQPEKLQASMHFLIYTVCSSLPLLLVLVRNKLFLDYIEHGNVK